MKKFNNDKKNIWKEGMVGNKILESEDVFISYNPHIIGGKETAVKTKGKWYVLKGDFRKQYEKVFPDVDKILKVFKKYDKEFGSFWTTGEL